MARARMIDVDYYSFRQLIKKAAAVGGRIEKRDKDRWETYIKEHNINEVGAIAIASARFDTPQTVIIDLGGATDGLYVFSDMEEACLRLVYQDQSPTQPLSGNA